MCFLFVFCCYSQPGRQSIKSTFTDNSHSRSSANYSEAQSSDRSRRLSGHRQPKQITLSKNAEKTELRKVFLSQNPHIEQAFTHGHSLNTSEPFQRQLLDNAPGLPYHRRRGEKKTVCSWHTRSLLLGQIEFLTQYGFHSATVLYVGAAPGIHVPYLASLFPNMKFVLIDQKAFTISGDEQITIRNEAMSEDIAREYAGRDDILLIADVHTDDFTRQSDEQVEQAVQDDMRSQAAWHELIFPIHALLRFRLPWSDKVTSYLDGELYFKPFAAPTSTETWLVTSRNSVEKSWSNRKYEEQLFRFNTVARVAVYPHNIEAQGIDMCYDCRSEIEILGAYLR